MLCPEAELQSQNDSEGEWLREHRLGCSAPCEPHRAGGIMSATPWFKCLLTGWIGCHHLFLTCSPTATWSIRKESIAGRLSGSTMMPSERARRRKSNEEEEADSSGGSVPWTLTCIQEQQTSPISLSGQMWIYGSHWVGVQAVRLQLKGARHNFHHCQMWGNKTLVRDAPAVSLGFGAWAFSSRTYCVVISSPSHLPGGAATPACWCMWVADSSPACWTCCPTTREKKQPLLQARAPAPHKVHTKNIKQFTNKSLKALMQQIEWKSQNYLSAAMLNGLIPHWFIVFIICVWEQLSSGEKAPKVFKNTLLKDIVLQEIPSELHIHKYTVDIWY